MNTILASGNKISGISLICLNGLCLHAAGNSKRVGGTITEMIDTYFFVIVHDDFF